MNKPEYLMLFFAFILLIPGVSALAYVDYDDTYTYHGNNDDGVVWGGYSLDVGADNMNSDADAVCFDWNGDNKYGHCFFHTGVSETACDSFTIESDNKGTVKLSEIYGGNCSIRSNGACDHTIDTGNNGDSWALFVKIKYFRNCGGSATQHTGQPKKHYVISPKEIDCDNLQYNRYPKIYGRYYSSSRIDFDVHTCNSNQWCDENHDDIPISVAGNPIPDPCRVKNGGSCSVDDDCISDNCVNGICEEDLGCNANQCVNYGLNICQNKDTLLLVGRPYWYYCKTPPDLNKCTSSDHTVCEKVGNYYCTYDEIEANEWGWESCPYGCDFSTQKCVEAEPDISVSPTGPIEVIR